MTGSQYFKVYHGRQDIEKLKQKLPSNCLGFTCYSEDTTDSSEFTLSIDTVNLTISAFYKVWEDFLSPALYRSTQKAPKRQGALVLSIRYTAFWNQTCLLRRYQKFSKTILPIDRPFSNFSCAKRRFAALMGSSRSFSVVFNFPSSIKSARSFSNSCCFIMSSV